MDPGIDLLILGASARAAAHSALRAGLRPAAIDLFADTDLAAVAPCRRVDTDAYPEALLEAARSFPSCPWIYTGALENHPALVDRIAAERPLLGNRGAVLRQVRDPIRLQAVLRAGGHATVAVARDPSRVPRDGSWLRKPLASAGGLEVRWHKEPEACEDGAGGASAASRARSGEYFQEWIPGVAASAVFVANGGSARLLGVSSQFLGRPGEPFAYRGGLTPLPLAPDRRAELTKIGGTIAKTFGLVGLFGLDLVVEPDSPARVVEVNPRYTASMELVELAHGVSLLRAHIDACMGREVGAVLEEAESARGFVAKEIVFAEEACRLEGPEEARPPVAEQAGWFVIPARADVPPAGTTFAVGDPCFTVFASGHDASKCLERLDNLRSRWPKHAKGGPSLAPLPDRRQ